MLNTIPIDHDSSIYTKLIKKGSGKQVILGLCTQLVANIIGYKTGLVGPKTKFVGSGIGGIRSTQEVRCEGVSVLVLQPLHSYSLSHLIFSYVILLTSCRILSIVKVIDLCDKHKIFPLTKTIGVDGINKAYENLHNYNDEGTRYGERM